MTVKLEGLEDTLKAIDKFGINVDKAIDQTVRATALSVMKTAVKDIKAPSHGKVVKKKDSNTGNSYLHMQSKEGDAPNSDTGRLIGSIDVQHNKGDMFAYVYSNLDYAFFLEMVYDRPFLEPAKEKEAKNFDTRLKQVIETEIAKA